MLDGIYEGLGEVLVLSEGLQAEAITLESTKLELFENKQFLSEVDEVRIKETASIMKEVFSEDVLASWSELTLEEKSAKLNEYYVKAGENLGINTRGVIVEPMYSEPGTISFGYNTGDGYIHLNGAVVEDPGTLGQVLETATHEMRHQFQNDAVANPYRFLDIPANVLGTWQYEFRHYIRPEYDYQGYYEQTIESDAREFSEDVLQAYMGKMNLNLN